MRELVQLLSMALTPREIAEAVQQLAVSAEVSDHLKDRYGEMLRDRDQLIEELVAVIVAAKAMTPELRRRIKGNGKATAG